MRRLAVFLVCANAITACATNRPEPYLGCGSQMFGYQATLEERFSSDDGEPLMQKATFRADGPFAASEAPLIESLVAAIEAAPPAEHFDILVLSGGGKWGAYGAGYLAGWTAADRVTGPDAAHVRRCDISVTTGISTGAMQIAAAYAATAQTSGACNSEVLAAADSTLRRAYTKNTEALVKGRGVISLLRSLSLYEVDALENLTAETVAEYAPKYAALPAHKRAYVGLVNLEDKDFYIADINGMARKLSSDVANKCIAEALLGSSAVPAMYPPRFIETGAFVDGGARFGVFGSALLTNPLVKGAFERRQMTPRLSVIINGNLSAESPCLVEENIKGCMAQQKEKHEGKLSLTDIALASMSVAVDQISGDSIARLESDLRREFGEEGYVARYTYLQNEEIEREANEACRKFLGKPKHAPFDNDFMQCAYEIGVRKGIAQAWEDYPGATTQ